MQGVTQRSLPCHVRPAKAYVLHLAQRKHMSFFDILCVWSSIISYLCIDLLNIQVILGNKKNASNKDPHDMSHHMRSICI